MDNTASLFFLSDSQLSATAANVFPLPIFAADPSIALQTGNLETLELFNHMIADLLQEDHLGYDAQTFLLLDIEDG